MKKKLLFLAFGALGIFGTTNAQTIEATSLSFGQIISINTLLTFNGQAFAIVPVPDIADGVLEGLEDAIFATLVAPNPPFNTAGLAIGIDTDGNLLTAEAFFGSDTRDFTIRAVPFDFGISAVLGAGAIAAVKTARRRRKEQEAIVA